MSVLQSKESELRYLKRRNLDEEARVLGGYYRDIIRSYGIDVNYYKHDTAKFLNFNNVVNRNVEILRAYGYDISPDYSLSAKMISYLEVEQDIFQLLKIGIIPDANVNFYFDSRDFACALAEKCAAYKEYPIAETEIHCEVPAVPENEDELSVIFPYLLGLGWQENVSCDILTGKILASIDEYELEKEYTVQVEMYEHTDADLTFKSNLDLYESMTYHIKNTDYVDNLIFLTYKVSKVRANEREYKYILHGKIHGNILYYDLNSLSKYESMLHPMVGDVVTIDFPDEKSREQYEITECNNKSLQSDGISPLLHKYIWKCKARRYINNGEDFEKNEANEQLDEKIKYDNIITEEVNKSIELYDEGDKEAYGDTTLDESEIRNYDKQDVRNTDIENDDIQYEYLDGNTAIDIMQFEIGTKLATDGYDLYFVNRNGEAAKLTMFELPTTDREVLFVQSGLKYLKATDSSLVFSNIEGEASVLAKDDNVTQCKIATLQELEICLESLYDSTISTGTGNNLNGNSFYKFGNCRTVLFSTEKHLFCRLASNKKLYKLI